ncbi:DUF6266 family protein [Chitinophaga sp. CF118]|uniref:DUF6266 family protein n=1 Tax=Chitinophaga sp. CF118 TaxID=1884367 RepID=UPI0011604C63|nr:DUF6266 family protein [Chitinophaga sp. CF118]
MARLNNGFLGGFSGIIGNLEGYMLNGQQIIRSRRRKSTKPPTEKQLACRQKMALTHKFLSSFTDLVKAGFTYPTRGKNLTPYNAAVSYQMKHVFRGEYPDYTIDYAQARLTEGPINTVGIKAAVTLQGNQLIFTWSPDQTYAHGTDRVMLLAYSPALNEAVYNRWGEKRSRGVDILRLSDEIWKGKTLEIYLSFISENGIKCSNSIYLGSLIYNQ